MSEDLKRLERLGNRVRTAVSGDLDDGRRRGQVDAVLSGMDALRPRRSWKILAAAGIAAAAAAVIVALGAWILGSGRSNLSGLDNISVQSDGLWFETPPGKPLHLGFKDGSSVDVDGGSRGRIMEAGDDRVALVLLGGRLSASIRKGRGVQWSFMAGSYVVAVKGTAFSLEWREKAETLDLRVDEGKVLVTGTGIEEKGIGVAAGSRLQADGKAYKVFKEKAAKDETKSGPGSDLSPEAAAQPGEEARDSPAPPDAEPSTIGKPQDTAVEWKLLIEQGLYAQAVKKAREQGLKKLAAALPLADLWELADAARYAEDGEGARTLLMAVRDRFGHTQKAKVAAFLLGRVSAEIDKKPSEAAIWFKVYLQEDPGGPLGEEALGSLVDAYIKCGRKENAAKAAQTYLEKYRGGVFTKLAESALENESAD